MTEIEKRAEEYADLVKRQRFSIEGVKDVAANFAYEHYCIGATEQKAIDITKACEWLIAHLDNYVGEGGWMYFDSYDDCDTYAEIVAKDFRKAMEE